MTAIFTADTANEAWLKAYDLLVNSECSAQQSRLGPTRETLHANFHINDPRQRWILSRLPAFSPAFAVAEVFWILAGNNNAAFLNYWNPKLPEFAGRGDTYHGAYGYRIRHQFGFDQLEKAYRALRNNPSSRQVIIQIWDPSHDFPADDGSPVDEDIPCNICSMPKIRDGKLEWLQIMRSNDLYRGTPYNIIQFSTIQEILAGWLGLELGAYHQISDSLHVYNDNLHELLVDHTFVVPNNTDSLCLPKDHFEEHLSLMVQALCTLSRTDLSVQDYNSIVYKCKLEQSYRNLLLITAADSARRRGWRKEMGAALEQCSNLLLRMAFKRWEDRYPIH